jgi:phosphate transport system permease protein
LQNLANPTAQGLTRADLLPAERRARNIDSFASRVVYASGITTIVALLLIFVFLATDAIPALRQVGLIKFFTGSAWQPEFEVFGILPLLAGSIFVTLGALIIAVPTGVISAVYIAEVAPNAVRHVLKATVELLAGIPSVVIGFIGLTILAPIVQYVFKLPTGLTALTGSILLAFMAIPTIASISEDAIAAVPRSYRDGSLALGATRWETIRQIVVPCAKRGITAACLLGFGRAVGETMAVLMVTGNASNLPKSLSKVLEFYLQPVRTLTATIASDMGETVQGSSHYHALFALGLTLFAISFIINFIADQILRKGGSQNN